MKLKCKKTLYIVNKKLDLVPKIYVPYYKQLIKDLLLNPYKENSLYHSTVKSLKSELKENNPNKINNNNLNKLKIKINNKRFQPVTKFKLLTIIICK